MQHQKKSNKVTSVASVQQAVRYILASEDDATQRVDNFLFRHLPGVPKARIYRAIRGGEVRLNSKRIKPYCRLSAGDKLRIPPMTTTAHSKKLRLSPRQLVALRQSILLQTPQLIAFNKPAGWSVHGGSGVSLGFIEAVRLGFPEERTLELVHRLDRDTSGCLLVAKSKSALRLLHAAFRNNHVNKEYLCLVVGQWPESTKQVDAPVKRFLTAQSERRVKIAADGKAAVTRFKPLQVLPGATLLAARLVTGRTHQIRIHASSHGYPLLGDEKYGNPKVNQSLAVAGFKGLALHARRLALKMNDIKLEVFAPLPESFKALEARLKDGTLLLPNVD